MENDELAALIQKSQDGMSLGLGAIAEVLSKMDTRLTKQEMEDEAARLARQEEENEEEEEEAKKQLIKDIASSVLAMVKDEFKGLLPVEGKEPKKVSGGDAWPMSGRPAAEDEEVPAKVDSATETVQKPLQAMQKQGALDVEEPVEEDGADEFPMVEDEVDEDSANIRGMLKQVRKQNKELLKANADLKKSMPNLVKAQMEKMGWMEEKGFKTKVTAKSLGAEEASPVADIKKSADGKEKSIDEQLDDVADKFSHKDLWRMRLSLEGKNRTGVPQELTQ